MLVKGFKSYTFSDNSYRYDRDTPKNIAVHFELEETKDLRARLNKELSYWKWGRPEKIENVNYYLDIYFDDRLFEENKKETWARIDCTINNEDECEIILTNNEVTELLYKAVEFLANDKGVN